MRQRRRTRLHPHTTLCAVGARCRCHCRWHRRRGPVASPVRTYRQFGLKFPSFLGCPGCPGWCGSKRSESPLPQGRHQGDAPLVTHVLHPIRHLVSIGGLQLAAASSSVALPLWGGHAVFRPFGHLARLAKCLPSFFRCPGCPVCRASKHTEYPLLVWPGRKRNDGRAWGRRGL